MKLIIIIIIIIIINYYYYYPSFNVSLGNLLNPRGRMGSGSDEGWGHEVRHPFLVLLGLSIAWKILKWVSFSSQVYLHGIISSSV